MKQVLLAIQGDTPSIKAFRYAVEFSGRIRAELSILRFIEKRRLADYLKTTRKKAVNLSRFLEGAFAGAALAEHGMYPDAVQILTGLSDPLADMLADGKPGVNLSVTVSGGDPDTDLGRFVESHHNVVLTILDASMENQAPVKKNARIDKLKKAVGVPVVVVKPDAS